MIPSSLVQSKDCGAWGTWEQKFLHFVLRVGKVLRLWISASAATPAWNMASSFKAASSFEDFKPDGLRGSERMPGPRARAAT